MFRIFLMVSLLTGFIVSHPANSLAQVPAPIQVSPQGAIASSSPDFVWQAVPSATFYFLHIEDSSGVLYSDWHTHAETNCGGGTGNCSFNPSLSFSGNSTGWWVMAWDGQTTGGLSTGLAFLVGAPNILSAIKSDDAIEINGTHLHFGSDPTVTLGGNPLTVQSKDANGEQVVAELPQDARSGTYELTLKNQNGSATMDFNLKFGGLLGLVLRDGNGNKIGDIASFVTSLQLQGNLPLTNNRVSVRIPITLSNGNKKHIIVLIFGDKIIPKFNEKIYFLSSDCSGTPYLGVNGFLNSELHTSVLRQEPNNNISVYVASSEVGGSFSTNSFFWSNGIAPNFNCIAQSWVCPNCTEAELVDSDLTQTFPPPYTLEAQ